MCTPQATVDAASCVLGAKRADENRPTLPAARHKDFSIHVPLIRHVEQLRTGDSCPTFNLLLVNLGVVATGHDQRVGHLRSVQRNPVFGSIADPEGLFKSWCSTLVGETRSDVSN